MQKIAIIFISIALLSCKEELSLKIKDTKQIMVVNGMITNESGPYTLEISLSSVLNEFKRIPYEGCLVILYENDNQQEVLTEVAPGTYKTAEDGITGKIGNRYSISILTPDGNEYESNYQELAAPVGIDSVYAKLSSKEQEEPPYILPGYQFYVNTKTAPTQENYFLWNMEETFEYTSDYYPYAIWNGKEIKYIDADTIIENHHRCWKTNNVKEIYTATTSNLTVPQIYNQPLHFIATDSKKLQEKYSLLLKQYTINKEAYVFWKNIEEQYAEDNFLVASQPYNISGNIKNTKDPDILVYGYFTVASITEKRIFVNRPDVPFYYNACNIFENISEALSQYPPPSPPLYMIEMEGGELGIVDIYCIDCLEKGATLEKPDFWHDK